MAPFYPLYVKRSDGKTHIKLRNGAFEPNEPTADQLDQKPNAKSVCDYYRECQEGDAKEADWRRKLGGMLVREAAANEPKDRNYILASLPENYRLYEHVKYKVNSDNEAQKAVKHHAAGGNERQDAYLYGHPFGRKKRFRSPAEFFPHLLWLVTDETGNPDNCSCKLCCPEEIEEPKKEEVQVAVKEIKQEPATKTSESKTQAPKPQVVVPAENSKSPAPAAQKAEPATPNPLPRFRSREQKQDSSSQRPLYRPGEIVWFFRGTAWGLGVLSKRDTERGTYNVQPLSHPFNHPKLVQLPQHLLRPWLAWSPPPLTCQALNASAGNGNRIYTFDSVDWQSVLKGSFGSCEAEVDGSILAAKSVEMTLTPFSPIQATPSEARYNGIFIGAEKIWVGDAVRLRNSKYASDILVLHDIIEQPNKADPKKPRILLVGDTYSWRIAQLDPDYVPSDNLSLPSSVRADLEYRNKVTMSASEARRRFSAYWRLERKSAHLTVADIKGRWYESRVLAPILQEQQFEKNKAEGNDVGDVGLLMNGQGDCNKPLPGTPAAQQGQNGGTSRPADIKIETREQALGNAVASDFKISKGLDEPSKPESHALPATSQPPRNGMPAQAAPQQPHQMQGVQYRPQQQGQPAAQVRLQQPLSGQQNYHSPQAQHQQMQHQTQQQHQPLFQQNPENFQEPSFDDMMKLDDNMDFAQDFHFEQ